MPTAIEWTDETWNPIRARLRSDPSRVGWHCEHKSPGCEHCYAEGLNEKRFGTGLPYKPGHRKDVDIFLDEKVLAKPLHWRRARRVFVCSMTDLFGDFVPDWMIDLVFAVGALCPQHTLQVLTKRSARMLAYMTTPDRKRTIAAAVMTISDMLAKKRGCHTARIKLDHFSACFAGSGPFGNIWLGVSVEDQQRADERIPDLLATPAAVRFLSCEPLLGPLTVFDMDGPIDVPDGTSSPLHWVICGGESGPGARPMHPDWARSLRDQCAAAGVPFFMKQWGAWVPLRDYAGSGYWPTNVGGCIRLTVDGERADAGYPMQLVGKKAAGRLLDGVAHDGMPV